VINPKHIASFFFALGLLVSLPVAVAALPYGAGVYGACTYDTCGISLTDSGNVALSIIPTQSGVVTIASQTVTVTTGASTGYTLQLESSNAQTGLVGGSQTIPASSATQASPQVLALNTWGYRVDNAGGFGAGPTAAQTNAASSSLSFAGVPALGAPVTLVTTSSASPSPGTDTAIWYGIRADMSVVSDTYSQTLTYTATTN
jgi:hypothetical protein